MELIVGRTYKSPTHSRYIQVQSWSFDSLFDKFTIDINWVDKYDSSDIESDTIQVYGFEISEWVQVRD